MSDKTHRQLRFRCLEGTEIRRLLIAAKASGERDHLLVELPLNTGLRPGETVKLRASSIHGDWLEVEGITGARQVRVAPSLARRMVALADEDGVIWRGRNGRPMTPDSLRVTYGKLFTQAGIDPPHRGGMTLRDTFATLFIRVGGSVHALKDNLGHRDISQ